MLGHSDGVGAALTRGLVEPPISAMSFLCRVTPGRPEEVSWLKHVKVRRNIPHILTGEEVERIVTKLSLRMRVIALLAYGSGVRISEICHLRIEDIHSDRTMIHVQRGKGDRQRRALLPKTGLVLLREWRHGTSTRGRCPRVQAGLLRKPSRQRNRSINA